MIVLSTIQAEYVFLHCVLHNNPLIRTKNISNTKKGITFLSTINRPNSMPSLLCQQINTYYIF